MSGGIRANRARLGDGRTRESDPGRDEPFHGYNEEEPYLMSTNLQTPDPRPGYTQRWIRVAIRGVDDVTNLSKQMSMGFRPRPADTIPQGERYYPTIQHGEYAGAISAHGMVLMERPVAIDERHKAAIRRATEMQTQAITQSLEKIERRGGTEFDVDMRSQVQRGRRPAVMPDRKDPDGKDL